MRAPATDILAAIKGISMFVPLAALALSLLPFQDVSAPVAPSTVRYDQAMRCAGVMAATSSLHAFTGNAEAKASSDRNGRGFITAATRFALPLQLTQQQLSDAFAASTAAALGPITRSSDRAVADAAIDQLNADHDACVALARSWVAEANAASPAPGSAD